jgi:hypothetical protein
VLIFVRCKVRNYFQVSTTFYIKYFIDIYILSHRRGDCVSISFPIFHRDDIFFLDYGIYQLTLVVS